MLISGHLSSLIIIVLSLEPEHKSLLFQAIAPTRPVCPGIVLKHFSLFVSHIYTSPEKVPIPIRLSFCDHFTAVT